MVSNIAIIPARGGSKRVPGKNILDFLGKPMFAYTIEAAIQSSLFEKVIVSTDCEITATIARQFGADVPFMRTKCADDHSPVSEAVIHALYQSEIHYGKTFDIVTMLMANCPIRNADDIKNAHDNFIKKKYESQISCFKFGFMNPWWAFKMNADFSAERIFDKAINSRSQDLPELYCPTGAIWIAQREHLIKYNSYYSPHSKYFEINWKSAVDIDNYEDIELAKSVFQLLRDPDKCAKR